jgi:glutamyl-tRNA synthetase
MVIGRLAPSPTGALHIGNARSFLLAWLSVRQQQGKLLLRIEDIDSPRVKPWAVAQTIEDLQWLGLDWDYGPGSTSADSSSTSSSSADGTWSDSDGPRVPFVQTQRRARYREVLEQLVADGAIYRCYCTRSEVAEAASAPHENRSMVASGAGATELPQLEGTIYPGTCRPRRLNDSGASKGNGLAGPDQRADAGESLANASGGEQLRERTYAWRWDFAEGAVNWRDAVLGEQRAEPARQLGDFVIGKSDWTPAYQLAVVVDDHDMGVTEVVRGQDLVPSTYRQLAIIEHLRWEPPAYVHVPLVIGPDGRRLAKRHGDSRLSHYRERGMRSQQIVGYLAWTLGMIPQPVAIEPATLLGGLDWRRIPTEPTVFDESILMRMD